MKADSHPDKKAMKGQTKVKHNLLEAYLQPWLFKIKEISPVLRYVDGFAGWGRYEDGSPGSPILAMETMDDALDHVGESIESIQCEFVEFDDTNFEDLQKAVEEADEYLNPTIEYQEYNKKFEDYIQEDLKLSTGLPPTFFFVDPFGFSGFPMEVAVELLQSREQGVELFINLQSPRMARFRGSESHECAIDEMMGNYDWRSEVEQDTGREEGGEQFLDIYMDQLREQAGADYVWPYKMLSEGKESVSHYLVYATNNFHGFKIMKDIMYKRGAEGQFAYLGPEHYKYIDEQSGLSDFTKEQDDGEEIIELGNQIADRFQNRPPTKLWEIMEELYEENFLIETHYRKAGKWLASNDRAEIHNFPNRRNGTATGFGKDDELEIISKGLGDWG